MFLNIQPVHVEVIIPVHNSDRPIARAVSSVLNHNTTNLRVSVVAHNTDANVIKHKLSEFADNPKLRILELNDGVASPAGPKNLGLKNSDAKYVSILDSDDTFEPGAVDSWVEAATNFEDNELVEVGVVIATRRNHNGPILANPPIRMGWRAGNMRLLDPVKDRLFYRTGAWGGLIRRERFADLRFAEGIKAGEDMIFTLTLWCSGANIIFPIQSPGYVEYSDQTDRTSFALRPVVEEFSYLDGLMTPELPWCASPEFRLAWVVKMINYHILSRVEVSNTDDDWLQLRAVINRMLELEPRALNLLSLRSSNILNSTIENQHPQVRMKHKRTKLVQRLASALPANILYSFDRQGPIRLKTALFIMRLRANILRQTR